MQTVNNLFHNQVVFSQWSRKSYAIFASLHRVVKIARLSIDVCNSALLKTISGIQFFMDYLMDIENQDVESDDLDAVELCNLQYLIVNAQHQNISEEKLCLKLFSRGVHACNVRYGLSFFKLH